MTSLMEKHLTQELRKKYEGVATTNGTTLADIIASGVANPDANVGVYIPDAEALQVFGDLLNPIVVEYHKLGESHQEFRSDLDPSHLTGVGDLDPSGERIATTRIRVARNLANFPLTPGRSLEQRLEIEALYSAAFANLPADLAGTYYSLATMSPEDQADLRERHLLFQEGDAHLEAAGINRDWPHGRGIFLSEGDGYTIFAWVNEEDERFGVITKGGDVRRAFEILTRFLAQLQKNNLEFAFHPRYGYLTSCPTNFGTGMRASVMISLPKLSKGPNFKDLMKSLGLQARGTHGEHSDSVGGTYDVSPSARLGPSEVQIVQTLCDGVTKLLEMEDAEA